MSFGENRFSRRQTCSFSGTHSRLALGEERTLCNCSEDLVKFIPFEFYHLFKCMSHRRKAAGIAINKMFYLV